MARLKSRLTEIANASDAALQLALSETAKQILLLARIYSPVDTGWLRDSYSQQATGRLTVQVGSGVKYSVFQEYGTSRLGAQPHLTPAFKQSEPIFQKKLRDAIKEVI